MGIRIVVFLLALATSLGAQTTPPFGIRTKTPDLKAFTNARIVVSPTKTISSGTLVIRDGRILDVGEQVQIPEGATVIDLKGKTIYPGFIDPYTTYGLPPVESPKRGPNASLKYEGTRIGANAWNDAVHAEKNWVESFQPDEKIIAQLQRQGITAVQSVRMDGIFRGRSFVTLVGDGLPNDLLLRAHAAHAASFNKGTSVQEYPSSLMGAIALIRQCLLDADWYKKAHTAFKQNPNQKMPEANLAIEALGQIGSEPILFETDDPLSLLRAWRISKEFNIPFVHVGSGFEYERASAIAATGQPVILPLNFPKAPDVRTTRDEVDVTLADLRHWERAAANPSVLEQSKVPFAFTTYRLKETGEFLKRIREAMDYGLSEQAALAALTTVPASVCGVSNELGTLERGKLANFLITDSSIFANHARIYSVYVRGMQKEFIAFDRPNYRGEWAMKFQGRDCTLQIKRADDSLSGEIACGEDTVPVSLLSPGSTALTFAANLTAFGNPGIARFTATMDNGQMLGSVTLPDLSVESWSASKIEKQQEEKKREREDSQPLAFVSTVTSPNKAFGRTSLPRQENVLIKNATIWTSESDGILENADLLVIDGKFAKIGKSLTAPAGVRVIDATDKHVSPGIIDEHSHIAVSGDINEGTFSVTPEVRIGDCTNPEDINIYRALAAGVTCVETIHGSANPIGGQTQIIKLRWGADSEGLKFNGATPAIKFALGENVKQSGWGEKFNIRYPQSRLGVETIIKDAFQAAKEYERDWQTYDKLSAKEKARTIPPRRDLGLETLVEVLHSQRFVHCHAYVATEMLMLMRLAEQYGFRIQNFIHVLEGYKIADELAAHGATASSAPDWWAYKFEVWDAIPHNMCLMNDRGVVTSINSDSPELGRRLPQDAAKSVMYCGMSQEDALKMVTINPAIQLKIDDRVGSIKVGKDADFTIWNDNPLSIYARAEQTWIDGCNYFSIEADLAQREAQKQERAALIQKVLQSPDVEFANGSRDGFKPAQSDYDGEDRFEGYKEITR